MSHARVQLEIKPEPDGFGFLYGRLTTVDGDIFRVDIIPPVSEWRGDIKMKDLPPHPTDWVVFLDGEEIARVRRREDLTHGIARALTERST